MPTTEQLKEYIQLMHPIEYGMGQTFGENLLDYSQFGLLGHNGHDYPCAYRTPIVTPTRMEIVNFYKASKGYGNRVRARSESFKIDGTTYRLEMVFAHLDDFANIDLKLWVEKGDVIGFADSTGFSTGNHLHFGGRLVRKTIFGGWKVVDPNNGYFGYIDLEPFLDWKLNISAYEGQFIYSGKQQGAKHYKVIGGELHWVADEVSTFVSGLSFRDAIQVNPNIINALPIKEYEVDYTKSQVQQAKDLMGFCLNNPVRANKQYKKYYG